VRRATSNVPSLFGRISLPLTFHPPLLRLLIIVDTHDTDLRNAGIIPRAAAHLFRVPNELRDKGGCIASRRTCRDCEFLRFPSVLFLLRILFSYFVLFPLAGFFWGMSVYMSVILLWYVHAFLSSSSTHYRTQKRNIPRAVAHEHGLGVHVRGAACRDSSVPVQYTT
jgi:hypothetical protein